MSAKDLLESEAKKAREQLRAYQDGYNNQYDDLTKELDEVNERIYILMVEAQSALPKLQARSRELDKAVEMTRDGMDPLIARMTAGAALEEEAMARVQEATEWDDLFNSVFGDETKHRFEP